MRYSEIMKALEIDLTDDSSKFAYHVGVLVDARIMEKIDDQYRLTQGGKEIFSSLVRVTDDWSKFEYQDSLRRISGGDVTKHIWSSTFILSSIPFIFYTYPMIQINPNLYAQLSMIIGTLILSLGVYWQYQSKNNFDDLKLEKFQDAVRSILGDNGMLVYMVIVLGQLGFIGIAVFLFFMMNGTWVISPATLSIFASCSLLILLGVYFSSVLSVIWRKASYGYEVPNYAGSAKVVFFVVAGAMVSLGLWELGRGSLGGGMGILGSSFGICNGVRKFLT
jgi:hypothetical protein